MAASYTNIERYCQAQVQIQSVESHQPKFKSFWFDYSWVDFSLPHVYIYTDNIQNE